MEVSQASVVRKQAQTKRASLQQYVDSQVPFVSHGLFGMRNRREDLLREEKALRGSLNHLKVNRCPSLDIGKGGFNEYDVIGCRILRNFFFPHTTES